MPRACLTSSLTCGAACQYWTIIVDGCRRTVRFKGLLGGRMNEKPRHGLRNVDGDEEACRIEVILSGFINDA